VQFSFLGHDLNGKKELLKKVEEFDFAWFYLFQIKLRKMD
jgi:hypothetical protein